MSRRALSQIVAGDMDEGPGDLSDFTPWPTLRGLSMRFGEGKPSKARHCPFVSG